MAHSQRGIALVLVFWAILVLSLVVVALVQQVDQQLTLDTHDARIQEARALAFSGLEVGLHPLVMTNLTAALRGGTDARHHYLTRLTGEGGKLNLNWIVAGDDPVKLAMLRQWLSLKGLSYTEASTFMDCLLDWVEPGNLVRTNGSKTDISGNEVPGRPLQALGELQGMRGASPLIKQPDWEDDLTLLSTGPVDLQWADEDLVAALPGVGQARARGFLQIRRGEDGIDGTADDRQIDSLDTAASMLGMNPTEFQQTIGGLVILKDPTFRIISEGFSGDATRRIEVVAVKQGGGPQILQWKEY